ncbi:alpha/beta hydrolase family protein [Pontibacter sp. CAU 1760]
MNLRIFLLTITLLTVIMPTSNAQQQPQKLITWQQIADLPVPQPDQVVAYGPDSLQFGELRLPSGQGPFPVVVVVHGGCWLSAYDRTYMAHLSQALTTNGYATWNLEFRRVGDVGGGWPGTFLDVAQGTDYVRELAKNYPLDKKNVVVLGHSAGGHLGLWLAARHNLPRTSPLYIKKPLKLKGVVSLAGITDLATYSQQAGSCNSAVPQLMEGMPSEQAARYADGSPIQLLPLKALTRLIQGALDPIVPVSQSSDFVEKARKHGDDAALIVLPNAGHFDLVAPQSPVQAQVLQEVRLLFQSR